MNSKLRKSAPCIAAALLTLLPRLGTAAPRSPVASFPLKYVGGSLPLGQHKVIATLANGQVVFSERGHRVAVPVSEITALTAGTQVRHWFGGSVLAVIPKARLGETEEHYVGLAWTDGSGTAAVQVLLKLSKSEYQQFLSALERLTGMKAVDANRVPTVVRYSL